MKWTSQKLKKRLHTFKVLCEWPSAREQLKLGNIYNSEQGIHLGQKLWINQHNSALNVYKKIGTMSAAILEKILEWDGSLDEFSIELSTHFPLISENNRNSEKELLRSVKTHFGSKKHRYVMKLLDQPLRGDISGIQDVQSYSPEYNISFQKYTAITMNEFLDLYPLPRNSKGVEEQSSGRKFHFLH